ncbi:PA14 domain-containing protein [Leeuwenhoekiella sp. LLG6367-2.1]|uniref:PA14 domain-containing protein n=1 Tax=Leeuwenhoekiella sp. LLG6367-2.1 TaxID=3160833 RepID=UPI00386776FA
MAKKILSVCFLMSFLSGWAQVGIGTTAPEASLDIRAANHLGAVTAKDGILIPRVANLSVNGSTDGQLIYLTTSTASYSKGFHYWDSGATRWIPLNSTVEPWYKVNTTEPATSNTDDIYIMGKVGIGSSNPIEHIEIKREGDNDMQFTSANANPPNVIFYNTGGTLAAPKLLNDDQEIGSVVFKTYDGSSINEVGGIRMFMDGAPSRGSLPTKIVFNTTRQGAVNQTANPGAMTINNAGNVGIGIADPTARLHITNSLRYVDATPGDDNGKVLTSDANGNASWQVPGANSSNWALQGNAITATDFLGTTNSQPLNFRVNNVSVGSFKVDNSLQLGREASSNAANATAVGFQAKATALNSSAFGAGASATGTGSTAIGKSTLASQNNSIILGDHSDDNIRVGIGTNTPTAKLQVNGTLRYVDATPSDDNGKVLTSDANGNASWQLPAVTETRGVQYYTYDIASIASPDLIELKTNTRISKSGDYNGDLVYSSAFNPPTDEDGFVVKITGTYLVKKSGNFIFTQSSDDGVRIYIDDVLILDDWKDSSRETTSSPAILLSAGKHKFDFWYYENAGGQSFSFSWGTNPDGNSGVMKASQFTVE